MITETEDIVNQLSAGMSNSSVEDYKSDHNGLLAKLDNIEKLVNQAVVNTIEQYKQVMEWKGILSSLYCYTFNNDLPEFKRVSSLEDVLGKKLYKFAVSFRKLSPTNRHIAKYLLWNRMYRSENTTEILKDANNAGMLRKNGENYFVIGMHLAVGDNVFSLSRRTGKQYRDYIKSCAIQAFPINLSYWNCSRKKILDTMDIPELEDYYMIVSIRDGKHCAKISFNRKDNGFITDKYVSNY